MVVSTGKAVYLSTIAGGVLSILTGAALLLWPGKTLLFVASLLGGWLVVIGALRIVRALGGFGGKASPRTIRLLGGFTGLIYIIVGAVCLRGLFKTVALLSIIIGLVWIAGGVMEIAWRRGSSIVLGALSIVAGFTVLIWPAITLLAMALVGGIWLIAFGVLQLALALYSPRQNPSAAR